MAHDAGRDGLEKQASAHLSQSIRQAFCTTVNASGLPPMTVLKLAALALGMIYKEAAAAFRVLGGVHHAISNLRCRRRQQLD
jgi:hypothetical protein